MSSSNNSHLNIPQTREAMDRFKMLICQEVSVNLAKGYNGHLTSRKAGAVSCQMAKTACTIQTAKYERNIRTAMDHVQSVQYIVAITR